MYMKYLKYTKLIPLILALAFAVTLYVSVPPFTATVMSNIMIGIISLGLVLILGLTVMSFLRKKPKVKKKHDKAILSNEVLALILFVLFVLFANRVTHLENYNYTLVQAMVLIYTIVYTIYVFLQTGLLGTKRRKKFSMKK